jgi:hypothetical protein
MSPWLLMPLKSSGSRIRIDPVAVPATNDAMAKVKTFSKGRPHDRTRTLIGHAGPRPPKSVDSLSHSMPACFSPLVTTIGRTSLLRAGLLAARLPAMPSMESRVSARLGFSWMAQKATRLVMDKQSMK